MKIRIISALIVLAIVIPVVYVGGTIFAGLAGILSVLAYREILGLKKLNKKVPKVAAILGLCSLLYLILGNYNSIIIKHYSLIIPIILILTPTLFYKKDKYTTETAFYLLGITCLLGMFFNSLIIIRNINILILVYLILIAVFTDTFAYAIGCLIGKHKMCPTISPNKSWEGFVAGLIGGSIISIAFYMNFLGAFSIKLLLSTIILSIAGQLGDLLFSKIKRENNIKDFSNIIPGHGGILDRFDSISFIVLVYVLLIWTL